MTTKHVLLAAAALAALAAAFVQPALAKDVYLDKVEPRLDAWWGELDDICRGDPGGSETSDLACRQRDQLNRVLERRGCWEVYPAPSSASSYWKCRR
jgi:hypothetical protein